MFEFAEEALDEIALAVEGWSDRPLDFSVSLGGDVSLSAAPTHQIDEVLPVIAAIGDDDGGGRQAFQ